MRYILVNSFSLISWWLVCSLFLRYVNVCLQLRSLLHETLRSRTFHPFLFKSVLLLQILSLSAPLMSMVLQSGEFLSFRLLGTLAIATSTNVVHDHNHGSQFWTISQSTIQSEPYDTVQNVNYSSSSYWCNNPGGRNLRR